ncbi:MAG: PAS domain S-box protein [Thermodesulfovibrionales bacterium]|jgi:PAS domain S-box-containing protein
MKPDETTVDKKPDAAFPIVGIGSSAGGLHSLDCFLEALPKDFDFAVVFIQHLSPEHKSLMPEILRSKWRDFEFIEIEDALQLLPGRIYLCPPAIEVRIYKEAFRVISRPGEHVHFPIDEFLVSLAEDSAERAIAVIFSGAGTDGVRGIQAVRTEGGTVFVQDPATAQFPELPQAAINTEKVDSILPPTDIAREIVKLISSGVVTVAPDKLINPSELEPFYLLIREKAGLSFNYYKKTVISRRIRRRMYLHGVASVSEYLDMVANKDGEAALLSSDLMIGVTSFFRDRLAWKALRTGVIGKLLAHDDDSPLRIWTPACATGEEAYSIAMMMCHEMDLTGNKRELHVFATDVNDRALEKAREGKYPSSISADVQQEFMRKFFMDSDDGNSVTVNKEIRQHVIFAKQDLLIDPPFSRLDLIICRNLLIYLEPDAQEKCITLFHYALKPGGYLFLGNAESPGRKSIMFKLLTNKKCRVYEKVDVSPPSRLPVPFATERTPVSIRQQPASEQLHSVIQFSQEALLEEFAPAAVTIDQNYDILYNNGPTNRYLKLPRGAPTWNLLELMPENLQNKIRGAIYKVTQEEKPVSIRTGITGDEGQKRQVVIRVSKIKGNLFLILFREKAGSPSEALPELEIVCVEEPAMRQLESELSATRQELRGNVEQLKSMNEELQSSNEELQAANEELETSREELQSLNEELITVNTQLQSKVEVEEETNNDLNNFIASTNIPTIFLDNHFRVKRYTPSITKLIKLIPSDVGRQIIDMSQEFLGPDLIADAQSVLKNLLPVKKEIRTNSDWYIRTALPYRTHDNHIEGVVVTYNDITELKRVEELSRHLASFPQLNPNPVIEIDSSGKVTFCNQGALATLESLGMDKGQVDVFLPPDIDTTFRDWDKGNNATIQREIIIKDRVFGETIHLVPQFDVARIYAADITDRKKAAEELQKSEERFRLLVAGVKDYAIFMLDPEGRVETWNVGAERLKGYKAEEIIGEHFSRFYTPEDIVGNKPEKELKKALEVGQAEEEGWRVRKDGSTFWASVLITALRDENRILIGFAKVTRDITERKKAEEAVSRSQKTFSELVERAPFGIYVVDSQFRIAQMNVGSQNGAFLNVRPVIGRDFAEAMHILWPEPVAAEIIAVFRHTLDTGEPYYSPRFINPRYDIEIVESYEWELHRMILSDGQYGVICYYFDSTSLREAEEALRKSEERFRALVTASSDVVYRMSPDWREMYHLAGRDFIPDTATADSNWLHKYIHPDDQPYVMAVINESIRIKSIFELEHRVLRVDGSLGWTFSRAVPLLDVNGEIVEWFGAASDVTERKRAEWAQETAVEFLRLVNESRNTLELIRAATAFFQERAGVDAVGIRLREKHDYPYFETRGFSAEFVLAESRLCACDKDGQPILDSAGNPALDCMCGNVICGRFDPSKPFFTKRGNFWSNSTSSLLSTTTDKDRQAKTRNRCNGEGYESVALIGLILGDERLGLLQLNDRRKDRFTPESLALWERLADYLAIALAKFRTDEDLQKSEEQFRTLANSIPNLAWWANGDGYITWYNRRWYEYTGTRPEQMEGWGWKSVHDPDVLPKVLERWKESIATGEPFDMEFPLRGADGVFRPFLTQVMPLKDASGLVLRWFGTNTDISAQKRTEESLQQRTAELEFANKELESFIYSVSHDLRAPLRHVCGFADLVMKNSADKLDEKSKRYLSIIHNGTAKMSRLIDDLLNLSRISRQEIQRREVNMSTIAASIIAKLRVAQPGRSIEVDIEKGLTVFADLGLIEIVLSNLLGNAWKFTSKNKQARIEFGAIEQDGNITYYVRDNGAGFDQDYAGKMFWPFHRLHSEEDFEGTGIGLAIVDRIIRCHGGKVWAEGIKGKGATIYFRLS